MFFSQQFTNENGKKPFIRAANLYSFRVILTLFHCLKPKLLQLLFFVENYSFLEFHYSKSSQGVGCSVINNKTTRVSENWRTLSQTECYFRKVWRPKAQFKKCSQTLIIRGNVGIKSHIINSK